MVCPIYLFTGFLESGKTSCIIDTFEGEGFYEGEKTVLLLCEEGEIGYSDEFLRNYDIHLVVLKSKDELNLALLEKIKAVYQPDRVLIEYNGMWNVTDLYSMTLPQEWVMAQVVTTIDASTFGTYMNNMRSIMYEQLRYSDLIICNRCDENTKQSMLRGNIKATNKKAQIIYESKNGDVNQTIKDELPFDIEADPLIISDDDYGLWYMDMLDHPANYQGKEIVVRGMVLQLSSNGTNSFLLGRYAMVCCADDTTMVAVIVESPKTSSLILNEWVEVKAQVEVVYDDEYGADIGFLVAKEITPIDELEEPLVYFN